MYEAYFDRTTDDNQALLLVEQLKKEFHVPLTLLPTNSAPGNWFQIQIENEEVTFIQVDEEKTKEMKENIQNRLARLQAKKKSRFKKR